jgi:hypothetical protein
MRRIRTVVYLDKQQYQAIIKLCEKTGAPFSELVRRAITKYVKGKGRL